MCDQPDFFLFLSLFLFSLSFSPFFPLSSSGGSGSGGSVFFPHLNIYRLFTHTHTPALFSFSFISSIREKKIPDAWEEMKHSIEWGIELLFTTQATTTMHHLSTISHSNEMTQLMAGSNILKIGNMLESLMRYPLLLLRDWMCVLLP